MIQLLVQQLNNVIDFFFHTKKDKFFSSIILFLIGIGGLLGYSNFEKKNTISNLKQTNKQLISEKEIFQSNYNTCKDNSNVKGLSTESKLLPSRNFEEFIRDWNTADFYRINEDTLCPREKGKNNFQRMFYKYDSALTSSTLNLKFKMVDQHSEITNYAQRIVVGIKLDEKIISEYDIPTRDTQVINFRSPVKNEGKTISSPVKDKSTINLKFQTQPKHGQEITQIIELAYLSAIDKYGEENKSIANDVKVDDPRPETARGYLFIGSYVGGCIQLIDWYAS